jgi:hypothetical protein
MKIKPSKFTEIKIKLKLKNKNNKITIHFTRFFLEITKHSTNIKTTKKRLLIGQLLA